MNTNIKTVEPVDIYSMDLEAQGKLCEKWNDPEQWEFLAMAFYMRGYDLNALHCFKRADAVRAAFVPVPVEAEVNHV